MRNETIQRTIKELVKRGVPRELITNEQRYYGKRYHDKLGFIDIEYLDNRKPFTVQNIAVQACWEGKDYEDKHLHRYLHDDKIFNNIMMWLCSRNAFEFWVWRKYKAKRGAKWYSYAVEVIPITTSILYEMIEHVEEELTGGKL